MTRTEDDLRNMYATAESTLDAEHRIVNWIERGDEFTPADQLGSPSDERAIGDVRSRRRWLTTGAVAAAVIAIAVTVSALTGVGQTGHDAPAGDSASQSAPVPTRAELLPIWHFTVAKVTGYKVTSDRILRTGPITAVQQGAAITANTGRVTGRFELSEGGTPGGSKAVIAEAKQAAGGRGRTVIINRQPGYFSQGSPVTATDADPWAAASGDPDSQPQLTWQLSDDSWAMVSGTFGYQPSTNTWNDAAALHTMTTIAGAIKYRKISQPVSMPFRLTGVPDGLVPEAARAYSSPAAQCLAYGKNTATSIDVGTNGSIFTICRADTRRKTAPTPGHDSAFAGLQQADTTIATRRLADGTTLSIIVDQISYGDISRSQAATLLQRATVVSDFDKPATWLEVK